MQPGRKPKKMVMQLAVAALIAIVVGVGAIGMVFMVIGNVTTMSQEKEEAQKKAAEKAKREAALAQQELDKLRNGQVKGVLPKEVQALVDIAPGEPITQASLALVDLEGPAAQGTFNRLADVVGKVAVTPIVAGEPINQKKLISSDSLLRVKEGMRAMTISMDSVSSLNGALLPGSYVDILVTLGESGSASGGDPNAAMASGTKTGGMTRTLLQNVQVIAVGSNTQAGGAAAPADPNNNGVTVMVTPAQAEMLALAQNQARLLLTLRNFKDKTKTRVVGADVETLATGITPSMSSSMPSPPKVPKNLVNGAGTIYRPAGSDPRMIPVNYSPQMLPEPGMPEDTPKNKFSMKVFTGSGSQTVIFEE